MVSKCVFLCSVIAVAWSFPRIVSAAPVARSANPKLERTMLTMINDDRAIAHVAPLRMGSNLTRVALAHSLDMANHDYFSHDTPRGESPFTRIEAAGLHFREAGENIGTDEVNGRVAALETLERLMLASPGHRANLLSPEFTHVGIGIALIGNRLYLTEDFKN